MTRGRESPSRVTFRDGIDEKTGVEGGLHSLFTLCALAVEVAYSSLRPLSFLRVWYSEAYSYIQRAGISLMRDIQRWNWQKDRSGGRTSLPLHSMCFSS